MTSVQTKGKERVSCAPLSPTPSHFLEGSKGLACTQDSLVSPRSLLRSFQNARFSQKQQASGDSDQRLPRQASLQHQKGARVWPYGDTIVEKIFIKWLFQVFNLQQMHPKLICLLGFCCGEAPFHLAGLLERRKHSCQRFFPM